MIVKVTQEHIDAGTRQSGSGCPVALALVDAGFQSPYVDSETITWAGNEVSLDTQAYDFIWAFDDLFHVEPFEFFIEVETP